MYKSEVLRGCALATILTATAVATAADEKAAPMSDADTIKSAMTAAPMARRRETPANAAANTAKAAPRTVASSAQLAATTKLFWRSVQFMSEGKSV